MIHRDRQVNPETEMDRQRGWGREESMDTDCQTDIQVSMSLWSHS